MNAKLCKTLRRMAQDATVGELREAYRYNEKKRRMELHPRCTKRAYRDLKAINKKV